MIALWAGALLMGAPAAVAADAWRPVPTSCVAATDADDACTDVAGAVGLWQVAIAPWGAHAYGSAWDPNRLLVFASERGPPARQHRLPA